MNMTKWKPPKTRRMNKAQAEFIADTPPHELCNLVEDVYFQRMERHAPETPFEDRRLEVYEEAQRLGLTDDNGVRLALELVKVCKYSSI